MKYTIYHPLTGDINWNANPCTYRRLIEVEATSLSEAWELGQNDFNYDYRKLDTRSTCVGDMIADEKMMCHIVLPTGFGAVPSNWYAVPDEPHLLFRLGPMTDSLIPKSSSL